MKETHPRIATEQRIANTMIDLYCRDVHRGETICANCAALKNMVHLKLAHCKFAENKPSCRNCPTHCWSGDKRGQIQVVMRYAGPRMLIHHPILAFVHIMHEYRAVRLLGLALGWIAILVGVVGIITPGLPTTPFLLLAAFLFSQCSPRFHQWLRNHRLLGKFIHTWETERALPEGTKLRVLILFGVTISISIAVIPVFYVKMLLVIIAVAVGIFLAKLPEHKA